MNPYFKIWFAPRHIIIRLIRIAKFNKSIPVILLAISFSISTINTININYWLIQFVVGLIFSIIFFGYLLPFLFFQTGKIWKGKASYEQVEKVITLAYIPLLLALPLQLINIFSYEFLSAEEANYFFYLLSLLLFWRTIITGLSAIQGFSTGIALLNILIIMLPFFLLSMILNS